jgi:malonyl CoA-acyl carrier protein transacylase
MVEVETGSMPKIACVFPGQGSQAVGMGYELFQSSRKAREVFEEADHGLNMPVLKGRPRSCARRSTLNQQYSPPV